MDLQGIGRVVVFISPCFFRVACGFTRGGERLCKLKIVFVVSVSFDWWMEFLSFSTIFLDWLRAFLAIKSSSSVRQTPVILLIFLEFPVCFVLSGLLPCSLSGGVRVLSCSPGTGGAWVWQCGGGRYLTNCSFIVTKGDLCVSRAFGPVLPFKGKC
jgi:hypothetical protein